MNLTVLAAVGITPAKPDFPAGLHRWQQDPALAALARTKYCPARRSLGSLASDPRGT